MKQMLDEQMMRNQSQMQQLQHLMQDPAMSNAAQRFEQHAMHLVAEQRNLQMQQAQVSIAHAQVKEALSSSDQMQVDSYPSPYSVSSSSGVSSPISPATPMAMSTPSMVDDDEMDTSGSSTDHTGAIVIDDDDDMDVRGSSLAEKLKKLGGPPSDVYYPYWPGFVMHPAFLQKEDWANMTLRPTGLDPDVLEQERQRYFEAQRRWQQEQEKIAALLQEHPELLHSTAFGGALNWRTGYWSGNWVPAAEKIDFSKIALRKTQADQAQRTTTSEAASQLQAALARRAALEAAAMSAVSSAQQAVSSSQSTRPAHRSAGFSASPRSPAMASPFLPSPQTPPSMASPLKSRPPVPSSPPASTARAASSPLRTQASPASLIWREFLRSHGNAAQQQQAYGPASST